LGTGTPGHQRPRISIERRIIVSLVLAAELVVFLAVGRKLVGPGQWEYWAMGTFVVCIVLAAVRPDWIERFRRKRDE
jgi:bacteriorhodopsin